MVLTGKEKAVAAFVVTLVLGVLAVFIAFSGIDPMVKEYLILASSIVTVIGTTLGVFATTNSGTAADTNEGDHVLDTTVDPTPAVEPTATVASGTDSATATSTTDKGLTDL